MAEHPALSNLLMAVYSPMAEHPFVNHPAQGHVKADGEERCNCGFFRCEVKSEASSLEIIGHSLFFVGLKVNKAFH